MLVELQKATGQGFPLFVLTEAALLLALLVDVCA
jgi:hypothetical protein